MEDKLVYIFFFALSVVLFYLGFFAKSKAAKWVLRIISIWIIVAIFNIAFLEYDCQRGKFIYAGCSLLPRNISDVLSALHILNVFFVGFGAPILALIAFGFEVYVRKFKSKMDS